MVRWTLVSTCQCTPDVSATFTKDMTITYVDNCANNGTLYTATGDIDMSTSVLKHPVVTKLF